VKLFLLYSVYFSLLYFKVRVRVRISNVRLRVTRVMVTVMG